VSCQARFTTRIIIKLIYLLGAEVHLFLYQGLQIHLGGLRSLQDHGIFALIMSIATWNKDQECIPKKAVNLNVIFKVKS
jgi:hypothetical protein